MIVSLILSIRSITYGKVWQAYLMIVRFIIDQRLAVETGTAAADPRIYKSAFSLTVLRSSGLTLSPEVSMVKSMDAA
jgi:hypothetical protein